MGIQDRRDVREEDAGLGAGILARARPARVAVSGGIAHFGNPGVPPELSQGLQRAAFGRRVATQQRFGKPGRQDDANLAGDNQKRRGSVIAGAHDDVAVLVNREPHVVADEFAERNRRRKPCRVHSREWLLRENPVCVRLAHVGAEGTLPALRPLDGYRFRHGPARLRVLSGTPCPGNRRVPAAAHQGRQTRCRRVLRRTPGRRPRPRRPPRSAGLRCSASA